jgi:hypothetical protein
MRPLAAVFLVSALAACGGGSTSAAGSWQVDQAALEQSLGAMVEKLPADQREEAKAGMAMMKGVFGGMSFELKADGTAAMTMAMMGQKQDSTGTWKQIGDQVTITSKERKGDETKAWTLKDGKLSIKEKMDNGVEMELVFERKK